MAPRVSAPRPVPHIPNADFDRALSFAIHHGRLADRSRINQSFMSVGPTDVPLPFMRGFIPSFANAAYEYSVVASSMLDAVSSATFGIAHDPAILLNLAFCPSRKVRPDRMSCEYIASALYMVTAMADGGLIDAKQELTPTAVDNLRAIVRAAEEMRHKPQSAALGAPLSFVRVVDSVIQHTSQGSGYPALSVEASAALLSSHYPSRNSIAATALDAIVTRATSLLRRVASEPPAAPVKAGPAEPFSPSIDATVTPQRLGTWSGHLVEANRLGNHGFDATRLRDRIELVVLDGFVDTPSRRRALAVAAASWVGAYVDGLSRLVGYGRTRVPEGRATYDRLRGELDELLASLRGGPAAVDIEAELVAFDYPKRLAALPGRDQSAHPA